MDSVALIIPAAGSGERLNRTTAKPFISIAGKTILEHTITRFVPLSQVRQIVVATTTEYEDVARSILKRSLPENISYVCVQGGTERQHSIYNALRQTSTVDLVAVHDAVRPFVTQQVIGQCIKAASEIGGAIVGVPAKDTIKKVDESQLVTETPDRRWLWQTQTPQIFKKHVLLEAYESAFKEGFIGTDDASLVERSGYPVKMVKGDRDNFKITYPVDLKLARLLLEEKGK